MYEHSGLGGHMHSVHVYVLCYVVCGVVYCMYMYVCVHLLVLCVCVV